MDRVPVTPGGYSGWLERVRHLKKVERPENVRDIERAREHGDLSENAEYHAAKDKQGMIMAHIRLLEDWIGRAEVIDPASLSGDTIKFGATVKLFDLDKEAELVYQIVGEDEADLKERRISFRSPLGRALIGRTEGEEIQVTTPGGLREYEITSVEFK